MYIPLSDHHFLTNSQVIPITHTTHPLNKHTLSAVTITTPTTDVYSMDSHTISCVLADIPEPWIDVMWAPAMQLADSYEYDNGHRSFWENTQMATLEISGPQLVSLKSSALSHKFTCKIAVGASKTIVSDTQTISIYTPSKFNVLHELL